MENLAPLLLLPSLLVSQLSLNPTHLLDMPKHPHDLNLTLEHLWHGDGHHMLTLSPKASNLWNNMSWSLPFLPRSTPSRPPSSWPLPLPAFAVAPPPDMLSNTLRACTHHDHPGQHTPDQHAPDRLHARHTTP